MPRLLLSLIALLPLAATAADLLRDDFSSPSHPKRKAQRGPWTFVDGTAACIQDDALYARFKNHGPILFYDTPLTDSVITFQFKPGPGAKTLVFTLNGAEGHIFRFVSSSRGTAIRAFPPGPREHQSISLGKTGPALQQDVWTPVKITTRGPRVTVQIGDSPSQTVEHSSYARPKTQLSLGFSFGTMSFKDLLVTTPAKNP